MDVTYAVEVVHSITSKFATNAVDSAEKVTPGCNDRGYIRLQHYLMLPADLCSCPYLNIVGKDSRMRTNLDRTSIAEDRVPAFSTLPHPTCHHHQLPVTRAPAPEQWTPSRHLRAQLPHHQTRMILPLRITR